MGSKPVSGAGRSREQYTVADSGLKLGVVEQLEVTTGELHDWRRRST